MRNGNAGHGINYGEKILKNGKIGVMLDMNKGILAFGLDKRCWGVAYKNEALKKGPIYPAITLIKHAGCSIMKYD